LTDIILKENNLSYDKESFEKALQEQKQRSRAASTMDCEVNWTMLKDDKQNFIGYDTLETKTWVLGYREILNKEKIFYHLILKENPFYGESGGQVGDSGVIICEDVEIKVLDTKKSFGVSYIVIEELPKNLDLDLWAKVDAGRRKNISAHHSATHLLQACLQKIFGGAVEQRGSFVGDKYFRFDFPCNDNIIGEKRKKIEQLLREKITEGLKLTDMRDVDFDEAKKMGAMCLFENKYGDKVRVVKFGDFSLELCGGTHVQNTSEIICFKITNILTIARGIKRIEAVAGEAALDFYEEEIKKLNDIKVMLCKKKDPVQATKNLLDDNICKESLLGCYRQQIIESNEDNLLKKIEVVNGRNFIFSKLDLIETSLTKIIFHNLIKKISTVVVLEVEGTKNGAFVQIGSSYSDISAVDLVKKISSKFADVNGGGNAEIAVVKLNFPLTDLVDFIKLCLGAN
jgi:alanyl-tRNA synthetase